MDIQLKGKMVILRKLRDSDAPSVYRNANHREVSKYHPTTPYPYRLKYAQDSIRQINKNFREDKSYEFGIELKDTNEIIGIIGLVNLDSDNKNAEVAYWIGKDYWGKGLAKESLKLILGFGFNKLNLERIGARVMVPNEGSRNLLESSGFKREGLLRKTNLIRGRYVDDYIYSILREDCYR